MATWPVMEDAVELVAAPFDAQQWTRRVHDDTAGAAVTFVGTTRNHHEGRAVVRLAYEAYEPMALQELQRIVAEARAQWALCRVAVVHRLGEVPVGEASVLIAVSSAHRREAMRAVEHIIDTLKERVPIWKKEVYADGSEWKGRHVCHA